MEVNQVNKSRLDRHFAQHSAKKMPKDEDTSKRTETDVFWKSFNQLKSHILQLVANRDAENRITKIEMAIQDLQNLLNDSTIFLPPYDIRQAQNARPCPPPLCRPDSLVRHLILFLSLISPSLPCLAFVFITDNQLFNRGLKKTAAA